MTPYDLAYKIINSSAKELQLMSNDELKQIKKFLDIKSSEIGWILDGRKKSESHSSDSK